MIYYTRAHREELNIQGCRLIGGGAFDAERNNQGKLKFQNIFFGELSILSNVSKSIRFSALFSQKPLSNFSCCSFEASYVSFKRNKNLLLTIFFRMIDTKMNSYHGI